MTTDKLLHNQPKKTIEASDTKLFDSEEIKRALSIFCPDSQVFELRILQAAESGVRSSWKSNYSGFFDNPENAIYSLQPVKSAMGIYFTMNPVNPDLLARSCNRIKKADKGSSTGDGQIVSRRWMLIDIDPRRLTGISSTDAEHNKAIETAREIRHHLSGQGWPDPVLCDSGNGSHLLYRIDLLSNDDGLIKRCLFALDQRFSNDQIDIDKSVFNPSRIVRLYGTRACKGDNIPDRPHRLSCILESPSQVEIVPIEKLETLASECKEETRSTVTTHQAIGTTFDVQSFIDRNSLDVSGPDPWNGNDTRWTFKTSPMCEHHNDGPFITQFANGGIAAACHHNSCNWTWHDLRAKIEPKITERPQSKSEPPKSEPTKSASSSKVKKIRSYKSFPIHVFSPSIEKLIAIGSKSIWCDHAMIGLPVLSVLAAAIGNSRSLRLRAGWNVRPILWTLVIGRSGSGKSPAFDLALKPTEKLQRVAFVEYQKDYVSYKNEKALYKKAYKEWERKKDSGNTPPEAPPELNPTRMLVADITVEALAPIFLKNPRGLLLGRDELRAWVGSFDKYGGGKSNSDEANYLSMHSGGSVTVDRKAGIPPNIYIPSASLSICGAIQPGIMRDTFGDEEFESGLMARFIVACPPQKQKFWKGEGINPKVEADYQSVVERLYELKPFIDDDDESNPVMVELSPEAERAYAEFYNQHNQEQLFLNDREAAAWSKLEEQVARIALILQFTKWAEFSDYPECPSEVDLDSMQKAIEVIQWAKYETKRIYEISAMSKEKDEQDSLVDWIKENDGKVTCRDLQKKLQSKYPKSIDAEKALNKLCDDGLGFWLEPITSSQGGRPIQFFQLENDNSC